MTDRMRHLPCGQAVNSNDGTHGLERITCQKWNDIVYLGFVRQETVLLVLFNLSENVIRNR